MASSPAYEYDDDAQWQQAARRGGFNNTTLANDGTTNHLINLMPGDSYYDQVRAAYPQFMRPDGSVSIPSNLLQQAVPSIGSTDLMTTLGPMLAMAGLGGAAFMGAGGAGLGAAEGAGALSGASGASGGGLAGLEGAGLATGALETAAPAGGLLGGAGGGGALAGEGALLGGGAGAGMTGGAGGGGLMTGAGGSAFGGGGLLNSLGGNGGSLINGIPNNVLAGAGQAALGTIGAGQQADAFKDVANQNLALGAPYRGLLEQSYQPGFDLMSQPGYGDAFNRAADISSRSWSAKAGNPAGSPTAQAGILNDVWQQNYLPTMSNYRGQLGQFGGLGLNTSGAAQLGGAQQAGGALDALGAGLDTALNPKTDWEKILRGMSGQQGSNTTLNIGGMRWGG